MKVVAALAALALQAAPVTVRAQDPATVDRVVAASWQQGGYPLPNTPAYRSVNFVLYADGRLLSPDGTDPHGVTTYGVADLDRADALGLRRALLRATAGVDFGVVPVPDAPDTRTRVALGGQVVHSRVNALGLDGMITDAQRRARERLQAVIARAHRFPALPWSPSSYEVRRMPVNEASIALEWPGPRLPAGDCGTIPAATYADFPDGYAQGSAYTADGAAFALWARPLLPGQVGCRP
ncbi:MAG: hypothetical protein ACKOT0_09510 [bacterium]